MSASKQLKNAETYLKYTRHRKLTNLIAIAIVLKSISKYSLGMVAKSTALAVAVILGFSASLKAEETKIYKTLEVSCNPFATLNSQCESNLVAQSEEEEVTPKESDSSSTPSSSPRGKS